MFSLPCVVVVTKRKLREAWECAILRPGSYGFAILDIRVGQGIVSEMFQKRVRGIHCPGTLPTSD